MEHLCDACASCTAHPDCCAVVSDADACGACVASKMAPPTVADLQAEAKAESKAEGEAKGKS